MKVEFQVLLHAIMLEWEIKDRLSLYFTVDCKELAGAVLTVIASNEGVGDGVYSTANLEQQAFPLRSKLVQIGASGYWVEAARSSDISSILVYPGSLKVEVGQVAQNIGFQNLKLASVETFSKTDYKQNIIDDSSVKTLLMIFYEDSFMEKDSQKSSTPMTRLFSSAGCVAFTSLVSKCVQQKFNKSCKETDFLFLVISYSAKLSIAVFNCSNMRGLDSSRWILLRTLGLTRLPEAQKREGAGAFLHHGSRHKVQPRVQSGPPQRLRLRL